MVNNWDAYRSVAAPSEGLFKDKGSRFMAFLYPVSSPEEIKPLVDAIRKEHHSARHHCYAYRLGYDGATYRSNDDGEPSGSAGKPILSAIDSAGLSDILIVVVRYFGGILLGVPGLIRAYREAAADAIAHSTVVDKVASECLRLGFDYQQMNDVQRIVKAEAFRILNQNFDLHCVIDIDVPLSRIEPFMKKVNNYNNEKGTRIQCGALHTAPKCN